MKRIVLSTLFALLALAIGSVAFANPVNEVSASCTDGSITANVTIGGPSDGSELTLTLNPGGESTTIPIRTGQSSYSHTFNNTEAVSGTTYTVTAEADTTSSTNVEGCAESPPPVEICDDGIDNDGDGQIDEGCAPPPVEICDDGIDNDGDGQIDEDCAPPPVIPTPVTPTPVTPTPDSNQVPAPEQPGQEGPGNTPDEPQNPGSPGESQQPQSPGAPDDSPDETDTPQQPENPGSPGVSDESDTPSQSESAEDEVVQQTSAPSVLCVETSTTTGGADESGDVDLDPSPPSGDAGAVDGPVCGVSEVPSAGAGSATIDSSSMALWLVAASAVLGFTGATVRRRFGGR